MQGRGWQLLGSTHSTAWAYNSPFASRFSSMFYRLICSGWMLSFKRAPTSALHRYIFQLEKVLRTNHACIECELARPSRCGSTPNIKPRPVVRREGQRALTVASIIIAGKGQQIQDWKGEQVDQEGCPEKQEVTPQEGRKIFTSHLLLGVVDESTIHVLPSSSLLVLVYSCVLFVPTTVVKQDWPATGVLSAGYSLCCLDHVSMRISKTLETVAYDTPIRSTVGVPLDMLHCERGVGE